MENSRDLTVLFSGRFDRPHIGHIASIQRLGKKYKKIIVVILDYPERKYCAKYALQMLEEILMNSVGKYEIVINKDHFAKISKESLNKYSFDIYASGNHECLTHVSQLGYNVIFTERAYDYEATDDRKISEIKKIFGS